MGLGPIESLAFSNNEDSFDARLIIRDFFLQCQFYVSQSLDFIFAQEKNKILLEPLAVSKK